MSEFHASTQTLANRSAVLASLIDRLSNRVQAGEPLDADAVAAEYPEFADELRALLPAIGLLGELSRSREAVAVAAPLDGLTEALGDFRIVRELGRGGMGVVYEAEQISLRRRVALKVLPFAAVMDPRQLQRFKNEALAAAGLDHPNVVKVYGVGCERGVHFIAMQFIDGRTLADLIRERRGASPGDSVPRAGGQDVTATYAQDGTNHAATRPVAPRTTVSARAPGDAAYFRRVAEWGASAADALEHAHEVGVVHRDIKPGNLLVDAGGKLFVADFGLAKVTSDPGATGTGDILGTLRYMSPEQAGARHDLVDHRSDIYSLGVTLYELLTLTPAFDGESRQAILTKLTTSDPAAPRKLDRSIPRDLETVVLKAIEKDTSRRYHSAKELAEDLRRVLGNEPVTAKRATLLDRAGKWAKRHRAAVWSGVALLALTAVVATAAAVVVWQQKEDKDEALRDKTAALTAETNARAAEAAALVEKDVALGKADANFKQANKNLKAARKVVGTVISEGGAPDRQKLYREALAVHEAAVATDPSSLDLRVSLEGNYREFARWCEKQRRYAEAGEAYQSSVGLIIETVAMFPAAKLPNAPAPFNVEHDIIIALDWQNAGASIFLAGRHELARIAYERALIWYAKAELREPRLVNLTRQSRVEVQCWLGELHAELGDGEQARARSDAALAVLASFKPEDFLPTRYHMAAARAHITLASLHTTRGEAKTAREAYRKATDHAEKCGDLYLAEFLADCPDETFRQPRRALELARKAHAISPPESRARRVLALALARNGEWVELAKLLPVGTPGFGFSNMDPLEIFAAALAFHHTGEPARARTVYFQFVRDGYEYNQRNDQIARFRQETAEALGITAPAPRAVKK